jgi:cullin 3
MLLMFNTQNTLTLDTIRSATQIPELELKRHLLSLCTPKVKILIKSSKGKVSI